MGVYECLLIRDVQVYLHRTKPWHILLTELRISQAS
jgi:hypothetical protein